MKGFTDVHIENDKWFAPFLLAASFHRLINFEGSNFEGAVLFWLFSPKVKAQTLIDEFKTKSEPHIPAKDLFEATEAFWQQVSKVRNKGMKHNGGSVSL